jgi:hypothetical protein
MSHHIAVFIAPVTGLPARVILREIAFGKIISGYFIKFLFAYLFVDISVSYIAGKTLIGITWRI